MVRSGSRDERLVAEVPFFINDILKAKNPVFLSFKGPSPVVPGCSISSSVYTDVETQSEEEDRGITVQQIVVMHRGTYIQ